MRKLTQSPALKAAAFVVLIFMLWTCFLSVVGIVCLFDMEVYTKSENTLRYDVLQRELNGRSYSLIYNYLDSDLLADDYCEDNYTYEILVDGVRAEGDCPDPSAYADEWTFEYIYTKDDFSYTSGDGEKTSDPYEMGESQYAVRIYVDENLPVTDMLSWLTTLTRIIYSLRFAIYIILMLSALTALMCFIYLMVSAGRRAGVDGVAVSGFTRLPFDLVTAAVAFLTLWGLMMISEFSYGAEEVIISSLIIGTLLAAMLVGYFVTLATRIKLGGGAWWRNTLIWRLLTLAGRLFGMMWRAIPLAWGAVLLYMVVSLTCLIWTLAAPDGVRFFGWLLFNCVAFPSLLYICAVLTRLKRGCGALAQGKVDSKVDTSHMFGQLKQAGEDLNNIGEGMTLAVEQRLKSERLKTELITNVSHDIKTPLTSIINYTDLLGREQTDNPRVEEYSRELLRQSERMKKLIEDLIEASKASTGNVELHPELMDIGVLLTQCAGEYSQRMEEAGLSLLTNQPDIPMYIMADGSRMWRVLDNLLGNTLKYALRGTRVYLTLTREGENAVVTLKNVSCYPLNIPADELLERFARGDASRSTSGSGLGLSIAKSLTELQGGELTPVVDGDLFKVVLRFPLRS